MKKRLTFGTWAKKQTPSGAWDNGLYAEEGNVSIPLEVLDGAIINSLQLKTGSAPVGQFRPTTTLAWRVTAGNQSWLVNKNPLGVLKRTGQKGGEK